MPSLEENRSFCTGFCTAARFLNERTGLSTLTHTISNRVSNTYSTMKNSHCLKALTQKTVGGVSAGALTVLLLRLSGEHQESQRHYTDNDRLWFFLLGFLAYVVSLPLAQIGLNAGKKKWPTLGDPKIVNRLFLTIQSLISMCSSAAANYITAKTLIVPKIPNLTHENYELPQEAIILLTVLSSYEFFTLMMYFCSPHKFQDGGFHSYLRFFNEGARDITQDDPLHKKFLKTIWSPKIKSAICTTIETLKRGTDLASTLSMIAGLVINFGFDSWHEDNLIDTTNEPNPALLITLISCILGYMISLFTISEKGAQIVSRLEHSLSFFYFTLLIQTDLDIFVHPERYFYDKFLDKGAIDCSVFLILSSIGGYITYRTSDVEAQELEIFEGHLLRKYQHDPEDRWYKSTAKYFVNTAINFLNLAASPYLVDHNTRVGYIPLQGNTQGEELNSVI